jgi:hypothetical protein
VPEKSVNPYSKCPTLFGHFYVSCIVLEASMKKEIITKTQGSLLTALCVGLKLFLVSDNIHAKESFESSPETKDSDTQISRF